MPNIDWGFYGAKIFDILLQGALAGFIVLLFTEWFRSRREEKTMRQYAVLLSAELSGHIIILSELLKFKSITPSSYQTILTTFLWEDVRLHFTEMPNHYFHKIALYYQMLPSTLRMLEIYSGKTPPPEHAVTIDQSLTTCQISFLIAQAYAEPKTKDRDKLLAESAQLEARAIATYPYLFNTASVDLTNPSRQT